MKRSKEEDKLHNQVCNTVRWKYPKVMFNSDMSGMNLSMVQAISAKNKRSSRAWPDLYFAEARGGYFGLYIEIKTEDNSPFKKDGKLKANDHLKEQAFMIERLKNAGYFAKFGVGYNHIMSIIHTYQSLPLTITI